jgi:hypothetical protein
MSTEGCDRCRDNSRRINLLVLAESAYLFAELARGVYRLLNHSLLPSSFGLKCAGC